MATFMLQNRMVGLLGLACGLAAVGGATGCERARMKQEAKQRIFSPPPPEPLELAAKEKLDVAALGKNPAVTDRINRMPFAEVSRRLGDVRFKGTLTLEYGRGEQTLKGVETSEVAQAKGGDFELAVLMDDGDEQHLVYAGDLLFVRHSKGRWRASRDTTDERLRWREQAYRMWPAFYELLRQELRFSVGGESTAGGRRVLRVGLALAPAKEEPPVMPKELRLAPDNEVELARERRLVKRVEEWRRYATPESGAGELLIDVETGVVLQASLQGALRIHDEEKSPARLAFTLACALTPLAADPGVTRPKDYVEEFSRRKIVTRPLSFLDGGSAPVAPRSAEPGDEEP